MGDGLVVQTCVDHDDAVASARDLQAEGPLSPRMAVQMAQMDAENEAKQAALDAEDPGSDTTGD